MPNKPLLSIITVNLNNLEGLKRTMNSVFNQTWQEYEYIIIDGGSTDGSKEFIEQNKEKISYWVSESDNGIYNAMNKGILEANGDYLLFLNSGDRLYSSHVLDEIHLRLKDFSIIYGNIEVIDDNNKFIKNYPPNLRFSYLVANSLPHPATFIKKQLFEKYGYYDEGLEITSDWKFFMNVICRHNVKYIKQDIIISSFFLDGISSNPENISLIFKEKEKTLISDFKAFTEDVSELRELKKNFYSQRKNQFMSVFNRLFQ